MQPPLKVMKHKTRVGVGVGGMVCKAPRKVRDGTAA